jgi:iron(III) transport system ATP-binding protein
VGDAVALMLRPERCEISTMEPAGPNKWRATVAAALFLGSHTEHILRIGELSFHVWNMGSDLIEPGTNVWLSAPAHCVRAVLQE